jgi:hypothetical protein
METWPEQDMESGIHNAYVYLVERGNVGFSEICRKCWGQR